MKLIRTVLCCIVYHSCTQSYADSREQFLRGWFRFCFCVCLSSVCLTAYFVFSFHTAYVLYYCNMVGWT